MIRLAYVIHTVETQRFRAENVEFSVKKDMKQKVRFAEKCTIP